MRISFHLLVNILLLVAVGFLCYRLGHLEDRLAVLTERSTPQTIFMNPTAVIPKALPMAIPTIAQIVDDDADDEAPASAETPMIKSKAPSASANPVATVVDLGPLGRDWKVSSVSQPPGSYRGIIPIVFNGEMYALSGDGSQSAWSSSNGMNWTELTKTMGFEGGWGGAGQAFRGKLWVVGSNVMNSTDGIHWDVAVTNPSFGQRVQPTLTAFKEKLWLIGGIHDGPSNDIWVSEDGLNWKCALQHAPFPVRRSHEAVVFNNKLWVIGGIRDSVYAPMDDIWCSVDGITWEQVPAQHRFNGRHSFGLVTAAGKLWVIAGDDGSYSNWARNDVWCSADGIHWDCVNNDAPFGGRVEPACFSFENRLWILGGGPSGVWCSPGP